MSRKILNLSDIRTPVKNKIHAKPPLPGAPFLALEMSLMEKTRNRLEKELERLEKRKFQVNKEINFLNEKIIDAKQKLREFCVVSETDSKHLTEKPVSDKKSEEATIELDFEKFKILNLNY